MSTALFLDIEVPLARMTLRLRWETSAAALGIFGPSGAGKTTVLETLAGLRPAARGVIRVNGRTWMDSDRGVRLPPEARGVGYVPQDALLFPHRDVLGNLAFARRGAATPAADPARVLEVLELTLLRHRAVATLSGGERQRVALGRALCSAPGLLLLDEPLAGLDASLRQRLLPFLFRIRETFAVPMLYVSHDVAEVRALAQEVLVLREGRVEAAGSPDEVFTRAAIRAAADAPHDNVVRGRVAEVEGGVAAILLEPGLSLRVPADGAGGRLAPGQVAVVSFRPEDLIVATGAVSGLSARNVLPGVVLEVRPTGAGGAGEAADVVVGLGAARLPVVASLTARAVGQLGLRPGTRIHLLFKAQACRVLAAYGREA